MNPVSISTKGVQGNSPSLPTGGIIFDFQTSSPPPPGKPRRTRRSMFFSDNTYPQLTRYITRSFK